MTTIKEIAAMIDSEVGALIKQTRISKGISRAQLAKDIGISFQQFQKYEKGENRISIGKYVLICRFLQVPFDYFVENKADDNFEDHPQQRLLIELNRDIIKIKSPEVIKSIATMIRKISKCL